MPGIPGRVIGSTTKAKTPLKLGSTSFSMPAPALTPAVGSGASSSASSSTPLAVSINPLKSLSVTREKLGGLDAHESTTSTATGHTIARHVGKSDADLATRLAGGKVSTSSTFYDHATATHAVSSGLDHHDAAIKAWLATAKPGAKQHFDFPADRDVGRTLKKGAAGAADSNQVRMVLKADNSDLGYHVLTAFPR